MKDDKQLALEKWTGNTGAIFNKILFAIEDHPLFSSVPSLRRMDMAESLCQFTMSSIHKYFQGQQQHGGDICDRDLDSELRQEGIDMFWYEEARKWKAKQANDAKTT